MFLALAIENAGAVFTPTGFCAGVFEIIQDAPIHFLETLYSKETNDSDREVEMVLLWIIPDVPIHFLDTSRCYATDVSCTCTHLGVTQLMFLALAHISVLGN